MKAYVFPGQGAQFVGMGKDLYDNNPLAKEMLEKANEILGMRLAVMHNLYFYNNLMSEIRMNLDNGTFSDYKNEYCVKLDTRI